MRQSLIVPKPQDPEALAAEVARSLPVFLPALDMLTHIQFYDQTLFLTAEIRNIWADGELAPEFIAAQVLVAQ